MLRSARQCALGSACWRRQILILTRLYPCRECAVHFAELVRSVPAHAVRRSCLRLTRPDSADPPTVASRADLSQWLCRTHNKVSARLGKPAFNCVRVGARWGLVACKDGACSLEEFEGKK